MAPKLADAFAVRYKDILDMSKFGSDKEVPEFTAALTVSERKCAFCETG